MNLDEWVAKRTIIDWATQELMIATELRDDDPRYWAGYAVACENMVRELCKDADQRL